MPSTNRIVAAALPTAAGLIATILMLTLLGALSAGAAAAPLSAAADPIRYVAPTGSDGGGANNCTNTSTPCLTVQQALDMAGVGDEIRVAAGTYTSTGGTVAVITHTVTLQGGWNSAFTQTNPISNVTTLDGQGLETVVLITPTALSVAGQLSPTIEGFVVTHGQGQPHDCNVVVQPPQACGGGIASSGADPLIINNVISGNIGANNAFGFGGGIYMYGASVASVISGNLVYSNIANIGGTGLGGGILEQSALATIQGNTIQRNRDSLSGSSNGGGIKLLSSHASIIGNDIRENVSVNRGGGIHVSDIQGTVVISGNLILSNTAVAAAGGVQINGDVAALIVNNTIAYNRAISSTAGRGGGIRVSTDNAGVTITHNDLYSNVAAWGGGSAIDLVVPGLVDSNYLHGNQNGQWGAALVLSGTALPMTATNNVIVNNLGGGIEAIDFGLSVNIVNNTVAGNRNATGGAVGDGVLVSFTATPSTAITATIVNNLLVSGAACGLDLHNPPAVLSHNNDVWNNTPDYCEAATGAGNIGADPLFVNAAGGDYHLRRASPAINAGSNAEAPATDKDGASRPQGLFADIGAYEHVEETISGLSAVSSSPTVFGQTTAFTAGVTTGTNVSYTWGFGNGATGSGASTTYTFPALGFYTALVTATNSYGSVTATTPVTVDDIPLAASDAYSTTQNVALHVAAPGVLVNDSDAFPGGLTAQVATGPVTGTLVLAPSGAFTYTPPAGFAGPVTFTYQASDGLLLSPATLVTITVNAFKLYLPLVRR